MTTKPTPKVSPDKELNLSQLSLKEGVDTTQATHPESGATPSGEDKGVTLSTFPSPASTPASSRPPSPMMRPQHLPLNALSGLQSMSSANSPAGSGPSSVNGRDDDDDVVAPQPVKLRRGSSVGSRPNSAPGSRRGSAANLPKMEGLSSPAPVFKPKTKQRIACVGSGSWATALARIAAINAASKSDIFEKQVNMWVREKEVPGGGLLTELINTEHKNSRYLPDVDLPENLVAVPKLADVVKDATLILFCVPHQFLPPVLAELAKPGVLRKDAKGISAIKGIEVHGPDIYTYPWLIEEKLNIPCSALGGANIALEVAKQQFCETTIGCPSHEDSAAWHAVFDTSMFRVHVIEDVSGVSLSGALKNIVAMAAGFVDGLDMGGNTKSAILRIGLIEMSNFTLEFFPDASPDTFSHHSAGVADLITTSFGGRNRKCAEAFVRTGKSFDELEEELLDGQKLQGAVTAKEIYEFLEARGRLDGYPLFNKVYKIAYEGLAPDALFQGL